MFVLCLMCSHNLFSTSNLVDLTHCVPGSSEFLVNNSINIRKTRQNIRRGSEVDLLFFTYLKGVVKSNYSLLLSLSELVV